MAAKFSKKDQKLSPHQEANRAGSLYSASKKKFSASYLFEEQGTSEVSEWFHISSKGVWVVLVVI